jgi:hypothetical protein
MAVSDVPTTDISQRPEKETENGNKLEKLPVKSGK